ncbi:uncharacterized protein LOC131664939 [Phymastichus coffea]|uniref:uncharacterized protein LOC131664939 n=1 Tax=Phymastichus coffea TaxID=108790 RepID=UPI00273AA088|nr:uncharacterized protein LOC131664939 [Phymastichus coffea]
MSCFGGQDAQIYLIELTVERLRLSASKYREDFADCPPLIKFKFIDFPVFVVSRRVDPSAEDVNEQQQRPESTASYDELEGIVYACGKSCLFVRKPRDLVAAMKQQPIKLGVFRGEETFPIAETSLPLSGCLCDQVAMSTNDEQHRAPPYELAGCYDLCDPGRNPAGTIKIHVRLTFFGPYIISDYQLNEDGCTFNNEYNGTLRVTEMSEKSA